MDYSSYQLIFYLDKKDEIYHYSSKEHPKISKIAKFGCEMLQNTENMALRNSVANFDILVLRAEKCTPLSARKWRIFPRVILKYSKFANFTGLYFPYFTTFCNQILQFY
jgi:hypothetical protein